MAEQFDAHKWKAFYEHDADREGRELAHGRLNIVFKELRRFLRSKKGSKRVLEIGVSDGYLIGKIKDIGDVYGIDIAFSMLKLVKKNIMSEGKTASLLQGSVTHLPFAENTFDAITACEVIEHLDESNFLQALKELKRILAPGGCIFITTPYKEQIANSVVKCPSCGYTFPPTGHYSSFDEKRWLSVASDFNFSKINIKKIYGTDFRLKKLGFFYAFDSFGSEAVLCRFTDKVVCCCHEIKYIKVLQLPKINI